MAVTCLLLLACETERVRLERECRVQCVKCEELDVDCSSGGTVSDPPKGVPR